MPTAQPLKMKLVYNGVDLAALASHFRVLGVATVREPAEAPQRERVTYRIRLDFFEQTYADNHGLIEQVRATLKGQQLQMVWQDETGATQLQRTVTVAGDETTEDAAQRGGTYWQGLTLSFWFYNHDVASNCLKGTIAGQDLGAVEKWTEHVQVARFDELHDPRRRVAVQLSTSGRWQADTMQDLDTRRTALLAQATALREALVAQASVELAFADFDKTVRIVDARVDVDQPHYAIGWSFTCVYTAYPDEANYLLCDYRVVRRESKPEAIWYLSLTGKIEANSEVAARSKLATIKAALVPAGYAPWNENTEARTVDSRTGSDDYGVIADAGDGDAFIELSFTLEYRETSTIAASFQRSGTGSVKLDLGTVDRFADRYQTTLFDDMRSARRRTAGAVSMTGRWFAAESLSDAARQSVLLAKKAQLDAELSQGVVGTLQYGAAFGPKVVRMLDFACDVNRARWCIEWSLSASFTRFPNEADYALCEFTLDTNEQKETGVVTVTLAGRIGAPTPEAAREKLGRLQTQLVSPGYALMRDDATDRRVEVETNTQGGKSLSSNTGDGLTYIELTFHREWRKTDGDVVHWTLRQSDTDDARTCNVNSTFSGTVQAKGPDAATAFATALAKAQDLGARKYPFFVRSNINENQNLFLTTGGVVFVTLDYSYEYQRKGTRIYLEVTSELSVDTFGLTTETVSGAVVAATLAVAQQSYNLVRNGDSYKTAIVLNERTPTLSRQALQDTPGHETAGLDQRFSFSFQVLRPRGQTSMEYDLNPESNIQQLEKRTTVRGMVRASTQAVAQAYLDAFLGGMQLGKLLTNSTSAQYRRGPQPNGTMAEVFVGLNFTQVWVDLLTGVNGLLECEVTEEVQYSGDRLVVKPLPDGPSIVQRCGTAHGRRTVTARAVATTESSAANWVRQKGRDMLDGEYPEPPRVTTVFRFLPQTDGVPRTAGAIVANVKLFEVSGQHSEVLVDYAY
jgi:hypothetical protein